MTDTAAIKGTYSDLKFIKTRKVAQVVIEVPIEQAGAFVRAFGTPQPDQETWVAIARLDEVAAAEKPKQRSLAQRAGMLCNDPQFVAYLKECDPSYYHALKADGMKGDAIAAQMLRASFEIRSRSELDTNETIAADFNKLLNLFEGWKRGLAA